MESIAKQLDMLIRNNGLPVFIEAEGRPSRLANFYADYNARYSPAVN